MAGKRDSNPRPRRPEDGSHDPSSRLFCTKVLPALRKLTRRQREAGRTRRTGPSRSMEWPTEAGTNWAERDVLEATNNSIRYYFA